MANAVRNASVVLAAFLVTVFAIACSREEPSPDKSTPAVIVGAGDIASRDGEGDEETAKLLAGVDGTIFALGDNAGVL